MLLFEHVRDGPLQGPHLAGLAQQRLHGRREGVVQGVDGVHLAEPDQRVLRRQAVQEHVLDLVQPRRRPQRRALVEVRLRCKVWPQSMLCDISGLRPASNTMASS